MCQAHHGRVVAPGAEVWAVCLHDLRGQAERELMHQVLATYRRDILKQAALAQAQRDAIRNRPFPPPTSGGELF